MIAGGVILSRMGGVASQLDKARGNAAALEALARDPKALRYIEERGRLRARAMRNAVEADSLMAAEAFGREFYRSYPLIDADVVARAIDRGSPAAPAAFAAMVTRRAVTTDTEGYPLEARLSLPMSHVIQNIDGSPLAFVLDIREAPVRRVVRAVMNSRDAAALLGRADEALSAPGEGRGAAMRYWTAAFRRCPRDSFPAGSWRILPAAPAKAPACRAADAEPTRAPALEPPSRAPPPCAPPAESGPVGECVVCAEARPLALALPCGHFAACFPCARTLDAAGSPCVMCRGRVAEYRATFMP